MNTANTTRLLKVLIALAIGILGASASCADTAEANIGVASNYVWRGASQTDDGPAVFGGVDYSHDSGFYAGTWASNVDFGSGGEVEWDLYGGYAGEMGEVGYDLGIIGYLYPDSEDADFYELAGALSFGDFSTGLNYTFASEIEETAQGAEAFIGGDLYLHAGYTFVLTDDWSLGLTVGYYSFEDDGVDGAELDYTHAQLDVTRSAGEFGDVTFSVSSADSQANGGDGDIKVFINWAKTF